MDPQQRSLRLRLGMFVLTALVLLAVLIVLFGGVPNIFRSYNYYPVRFTNAQGIQKGTPVLLSGIRIGQVTGLRLDEKTGDVVVQVGIEKQYQLYPGDEFTLVNDVLGGDARINIVRYYPRADAEDEAEPIAPPKPQPTKRAVEPPPPEPPTGAEEESQVNDERKPVPPGTEFKGVRQPDVATVLKLSADLVAPTQEALKQIQKSLTRLEKMAPLTEETLREYRDLARSARETIPELRRTSDEVTVTARTWGKLGERLDVWVQANQDKISKTIDNINDTTVRAGNLLNDENQRNVAATLKNVRAASEDLPSAIDNADGLFKEARGTVKLLDSSLTKFDAALADIQRATRPFGDRSDRILRNIDESAENLNKVLVDVRALLQGIGQGNGTIQKLLTDPALYNRVDETLCMVQRLAPRLDRILRDLEVFADKLARHPEALGIGGAIRPGSGLKDAPTPYTIIPKR